MPMYIDSHCHMDEILERLRFRSYDDYKVSLHATTLPSPVGCDRKVRALGSGGAAGQLRRLRVRLQRSRGLLANLQHLVRDDWAELHCGRVRVSVSC